MDMPASRFGKKNFPFRPDGMHAPFWFCPAAKQDTGTLQRSGNILMHVGYFDKSKLLFLSVIARWLLVGLCRFTKNVFAKATQRMCIVQKNCPLVKFVRIEAEK